MASQESWDPHKLYDPQRSGPTHSNVYNPNGAIRLAPLTPSYYKEVQAPLLNGPDPTNAKASKLQWAPLSVVITGVWIVFILGTIIILEQAVSTARVTFNEEWKYRVLPGVLLTIFAQGHSAVTSFLLGRLALSGLHSSSTSPNTWRELFWMSDGYWSGPVGILGSVWRAVMKQARISVTFWLFSLTIIISIITPTIFERSYPIATIVVVQNGTYRPFTVKPQAMEFLDAYRQIGAGYGGWTTTQPILALFNASVYTPPGVQREASDASYDFFLAGDAEGKDTSLIGVRTNGSCTVVEDLTSSADPFEPVNRLKAKCDSLKLVPTWNVTITTQPSGRSMNYSYCSVVNEFMSWRQVPGASNTTATLSGYAAVSGKGDHDDISQGIVYCENTITLGEAKVNGTTRTFDSLEPQGYYKGYGGEEPVHPLWGALNQLKIPTANGDVIGADVLVGQWMNAIGFTTAPSVIDHGDGGQDEPTVFFPNISMVALRLSEGIQHMANGMVISSLASDTDYPYTQNQFVAVRIRDRTFAIASYFFLGLWLILLIYLSARMYRPTVSDSLSSYVVASLLMGEPHLVGENVCGGEGENERLSAPFQPIGDARPHSGIGLIRSGGEGQLLRSRFYS